MRGQSGVAIVAATLVTSRDAKSTTMISPGSIRAMEPRKISSLEASALAGTRKANAPSCTERIHSELPSWVPPVRRGTSQQQQPRRQQQNAPRDAARHAKIDQDSGRMSAPATAGAGGRGTDKAGRVRRRGPMGVVMAVEAGARRPTLSGNAKGSSASPPAAAAAAAAAAGVYGELRLLRGGAHGTAGWVSRGGGEQYVEFPDDFDYEYDSGSTSGGGGSGSDTEDGGDASCWFVEDEGPMDNVEAVARPPLATSKPGLEDGAVGASPAASARGPSGRSVADTAHTDAHDHDGTHISSALSSSRVVTTTPGRGIGAKARDDDPTRDDRRQGHQVLLRPALGAVVGTLLGAAGLKLWEGLLEYRRRRGGAASDIDRDSGGVEGGGARVEGGQGAEEEGVGHEEAGVAQQQSKIQALEDQLSFLEEDRRRVVMAAKEARANRRRDDKQLREYVHTLEVHLDQLSNEKQESEAAMLELVRSETAKALEQAQEGNQATALAAAEEARRARSEFEATQVVLEAALSEQKASAQEKAAAEALLRTEQARGVALEKEVERLRESTAALTQRLLNAVAKADRDAAAAAAAAAATAARTRAAEEEEGVRRAAVAAEVAAAREEETARCRQEMEVALAEEKERLREQMEERLAAMRAGLKRRLQEARSKRAAAAAASSSVAASEAPARDGASGSGNNLPPQ